MEIGSICQGNRQGGNLYRVKGLKLLAEGNSTIGGPIGLVKCRLDRERQPSSSVSTSPSMWWSKRDTFPTSELGCLCEVSSCERFWGDGGREFNYSSRGKPCILHERWRPWLATMIRWKRS